MTDWSKIKRSEKPLDYKAILERVCLTPERLNNFINEQLTRRHKMADTNDEVVNMDELLNAEETIIEEDADVEPDAEIVSTDDEEIEEVDDEDEIEEV